MSRFGTRLRLILLPLTCVVSVSPTLAQTPEKSVEKNWTAGIRALEDSKFETAVTDFNKVLQVLTRPDAKAQNRQLGAAYEYRADAQYGLNHWQQAVEDYTRAISYEPHSAHAFAFRGIARKATGDYDGLISDEEVAAKLDPEYASLLDDAHSTINWRRALTGFFALGAAIVMMGVIPFVKALVRIGNAEKESRRSDKAL